VDKTQVGFDEKATEMLLSALSPEYASAARAKLLELAEKDR
jgi:hypothetical protein